MVFRHVDHTTEHGGMHLYKTQSYSHIAASGLGGKAPFKEVPAHLRIKTIAVVFHPDYKPASGDEALHQYAFATPPQGLKGFDCVLHKVADDRDKRWNRFGLQCWQQ